MPNKPKSKPGTERRRDEQRRDGGPRMHGRDWHDHDELRDLQRERATALDAVPEVEGAPERVGMGRGRGAPYRNTSGRRELSRTPRGKGVSDASNEGAEGRGPDTKTELDQAEQRAARKHQPGARSRPSK